VRRSLSMVLCLLASWTSLAAEKSSVAQRISLVGFIRVGASDAQSLVVLKDKSSGKTLFLRRFEMIPGTAYRLLRFERDQVQLLSPKGREVLRLESSQGRESEETALVAHGAIPAISINPVNWQQLMRQSADVVPLESEEVSKPSLEARRESLDGSPKPQNQASRPSARGTQSQDFPSNSLPVAQEESEIIAWEPPLEAQDEGTCSDCARNEAAQLE
jgi:hypothetical protein